MGLVDYSESDSSASESEAPPKPQTTKQNATSKKPFQKVVDRSNPGKIIVSLPTASESDVGTKRDDEPPAKRARTEGGGRFSGFSSFLPAPKNLKQPAASAAKSAPGIGLRTSAAPGFSRDAEEVEVSSPSGGLGLPPPKAPSIPTEQKAAEDVKLVGKPTMFRPLSVTRKPKKKKAMPVAVHAPPTAPEVATAAPEAPVKKPSLFTLHKEDESEAPASNERYEPLFSTRDPTFDEYDQQYHQADAHVTSHAPTTAPTNSDESLDSIARDMNLSASARRELFGRTGTAAAGTMASKVLNFNMDTEYQANEEMRASGEQQTHNPVHAIHGGGRHNLRQLVQNVQGQKEAYEDSFAKGRNNRKEAANRYGW